MNGLELKFTSLYFTGMPDRVLRTPKGRIFFVELKSENGRTSKRQKIVQKLLIELGFSVNTINTDEKLS